MVLRPPLCCGKPDRKDLLYQSVSDNRNLRRSQAAGSMCSVCKRCLVGNASAFLTPSTPHMETINAWSPGKFGCLFGPRKRNSEGCTHRPWGILNRSSLGRYWIKRSSLCCRSLFLLYKQKSNMCDAMRIPARMSPLLRALPRKPSLEVWLRAKEARECKKKAENMKICKA